VKLPPLPPAPGRLSMKRQDLTFEERQALLLQFGDECECADVGCPLCNEEALAHWALDRRRRVVEERIRSSARACSAVVQFEGGGRAGEVRAVVTFRLSLSEAGRLLHYCDTLGIGDRTPTVEPASPDRATPSEGVKTRKP